MAQKPDYYTVLGVSKTASVEDIKKAHKRIAMTSHPDMLRNKTDAEKATAKDKFQLATEALEVLTDAAKRATYDRFGHQGLDNLKSSGTSGSTTSNPNMPVRKEMPTTGDTFSFFDKIADAEAKPSTPSTTPRESAAERAARTAEERRKARERQTGAASTTTPPVKDAFNDLSLADKMADVKARLNEAVQLVEDLKKEVAGIEKEVDKSRKTSGPGGNKP